MNPGKKVVILGRKGVLVLNAVATMHELDLVKADIPKVIHIANFTSGNSYKDFNPEVDEVAAWTIGGLVAGKVLAKVGELLKRCRSQDLRIVLERSGTDS